MVTAKPKGKYTYADYAATPEGERWELIDGALYHMAAAPNTKHHDVSDNTGDLVKAVIQPQRLGRVYRAPFALMLSGTNTVEPDLMYVSAARQHIITNRGCEGIPDLVVEILSPSNSANDLAVKRELYARYGIPEYWILDPVGETVLALTEPVINDGIGEYTAEARHQIGDTLTTDRIPGLSIAVADIFADPW
ncbi:MAG: Uma2 family endonuclease [Dehalococcoidia bacterium]|nr:Uma2 family endonuclease [Dehalococcoidia bacterium]